MRVFVGVCTHAAAVIAFGRLSRIEKNKRGNQRVFVSVDSLLLFAFASLSARPVQTPASRSPGGTPPSSASRAGTPRSCHTCGAKGTHDIGVLARPLNSPFPSMSTQSKCKNSPRTRCNVFSPLMVEDTVAENAGNRHGNKMSLRHHDDDGAPWERPAGVLASGAVGEPGSCNCQHNFTCHYFLLS